MNKTIFVFGSNEAGRHGAGAALEAVRSWGAVYGMSYGHYGNSFAIPTKNSRLETLNIFRINGYVQGFISYARGHRDLTFKVTQLGCGLAGLRAEQIAPMFIEAPGNCEFDIAWSFVLGPLYTYWGTYA